MRSTSETKRFVFQKPHGYTLQQVEKNTQRWKRVGTEEKASECIAVQLYKCSSPAAPANIRPPSLK